MKQLTVLFSLILLVSCKKDQVQPQDYIDVKPVLIKVQAVHNDGYIIESPITVVR